MNPTFTLHQVDANVGVGSSNVMSQSLQMHEPAYVEGDAYTIDQNEETTLKFTENNSTNSKDDI